MSCFSQVPSWLTGFFLAFLSASVVIASPVIQVEKVSFDKVSRNDILRARIQLSTTGNPSNTAQDPRFLDDVQLDFFLSFGDKRNGYYFYASQVNIVSLKQGKLYVVDFFIPGEIVDRDRLNTNPFAFLLNFRVGDFEIPFDSSYASSNMLSENARSAFVAKADEARAVNDGIMLPSYDAPFYLSLEQSENYPPFRRIQSGN